MGTHSLTRAKAVKDDEFYTFYGDVDKELSEWEEYFVDKKIYLPCDNGHNSEFFNWFFNASTRIPFKYVVATSLNGEYKKILPNRAVETTGLKSGDFRSKECQEIMENCDIVITNPPFSLWREFLEQIETYNKKFLLIGSETLLATKKIFKLYKNGEIGLGKNRGGMKFWKPDYSVKKFGNICWYQNLQPDRAYGREWQGGVKYNPENYEKYANLNALYVRKAKDIPRDYDGLMMVPISYLPRWNRQEHELLARGNDKDWLKEQGVEPLGEEVCKKLLEQGNKAHLSPSMYYPYMQNKEGEINLPFVQIVIKRKQH